MDVEKQNKIFDRFGGLFRHRYIECGNGWMPLIWMFLLRLEELVMETERQSPPEPGMEIVIVQMKEKYGGLRIYLSTANDEIYALVDQYEKMSKTICERCGKNHCGCK
jgi:hypothetical protein